MGACVTRVPRAYWIDPGELAHEPSPSRAGHEPPIKSPGRIVREFGVSAVRRPDQSLRMPTGPLERAAAAPESARASSESRKVSS